MIQRYRLPEMAAVWSEERRLAAWQEIEVLAADAQASLGIVPEQAAESIRRARPVDPEAVRAREQTTGHDKAAFVDVLAEAVGEGGEWVHYGLTSSDVEDTANAVLMREAGRLLAQRMAVLFEVVRRLALGHRDTTMIGRTHGVWAEPTTFGLKLAGWVFELQRDLARLRRATETVAVGKLSGAVGTYAHMPPEVEQLVCDKLGLAVEPASSQVVARDRHAEFLQVLALIGATLERFATEIRLLQRSEVAEVSEPFSSGQKGSSAMPHKRNPVRSERICGLARLLRGYAQAGLENVALWHERDISHSSAERVAIPDSCLLLDFMLAEMSDVLENLEVDAGRMRANLEATQGLVFSQTVLLSLVEAGLGRDEAYRIIQTFAGRARKEGRHLRDVLAEENLPIDEHQLAACFDPARILTRTTVVFERLEKAEI